MKIIPLSELRDTKHISDMILHDNEPIFVTKQGAQHLVVMPHELYVDMQREIRELKKML